MTKNTGRWGGFLPEPTELPDAAAVRAKYQAERAKRLAADRSHIAKLTGVLAHYLDDPYTPASERAPVEDEVDAVVVGAGFGGLMTSARLREAGLSGVRLIDRAGDVGGVWYWNRYPGVMCDVESYIYLPMLEETGYIPRDKYASGPEIFEYCQLLARRYELYPLALFQTAVTGMHWDEAMSRWIVKTDRGDTVRAKYVAACNGIFTNPKLPAVPGIETFQGKTFHTSRWNYAYTGGDVRGGLTGLADKRVGVVGTGATAVQVVPHVGRDARETYVFQRTPSTVGPRNNRPTDPTFAQGLTPGWQRRRMQNFTDIVSGAPQREDLVHDGWTAFYGPLRRPLQSFGHTREEAMAAKERLDLQQMEAIRARIDAVVKDTRKAELLKPYYSYHCKRPTFHDEYLEAFNRPNVILVDTEGVGIEQVLPDGVIAGGRKYALDCLIFATGFEYESGVCDKGFDIVGLGGQSLDQKWSQGVSSLHGLMTRGFPNFFVMPGANSQALLTVNFSHAIQENANHIGYVVGQVEAHGARSFDVSQQAESDWVARIVAGADRLPLEGCTPGRFTNEGRLDERPLANSNFPGAASEFFSTLAAWREAGGLPGLVLQDEPVTALAPERATAASSVPGT